MESKYRHLYKLLLDKIDKREYEPGDKLPAEGELMEAYGGFPGYGTQGSGASGSGRLYPKGQRKGGGGSGQE
ncbi:GntR family transcriptional regulator [Lacrimispora xylanisolvens]|uniref:GntR family transcriptional regulator n=1 Tax=Lacrimispora xylanisolvens TaxID=384636 RepID=UPI003D9C9BF2